MDRDRRQKKAQTATEYMIILAVVIIIALIVVQTIGGFIPGMGGNVRSRTSQSYWQNADVAIASAGMSAGDNHIVKIRNQMRNVITITQINMSVSGSTDPVQFYSSHIVLAPGQAVSVMNDTSFDICRNPGDSFTSYVKIRYFDDETSRSYTFTGDGNALIGTCAH